MQSDRELFDELKSLSRDELEVRFLRTLTMYHSSKWIPTGFFNALPERAERISVGLESLTRQLDASAKAQERLATALVWLTALLVLTGALGIYFRL